MTYLNQHSGDGHYLSVISTSMLTSHIIGSSRINYVDVTPIVPLITEYVIFSVNSKSTIKSFSDLVDVMKKNPIGLSFAVGGGLGNPNHAAIASALKIAGVDVRKMKAVAFGGGGEAMTALLGGHVDVLAAGATTLASQVKSDNLRFIAVAAPKRLKGDFSAIPTLKEQKIDLVFGFTRYIVGPKGLSKEQLAFWNLLFSNLMKSPDWQSEVEKQNWKSDYLNSADTEKELQSNYKELHAILSDLGMAK